jgi:hypothetical protein
MAISCCDEVDQVTHDTLGTAFPRWVLTTATDATGRHHGVPDRQQPRSLTRYLRGAIHSLVGMGPLLQIHPGLA